jgi:hypothetical protein
MRASSLLKIAIINYKEISMDEKKQANIIAELDYCLNDVAETLEITYDQDEQIWLTNFHRQLLEDARDSVDYCAIATSIIAQLNDKAWAKKLYLIAYDKANNFDEMVEVVEAVIDELEDQTLARALCNKAYNWVVADDAKQYYRIAELILSPLINNVEWAGRLLKAAAFHACFAEDADRAEAKLAELGIECDDDSETDTADDDACRGEYDNNCDCGDMEYHIMEYLAADRETVQGFVLLEAQIFKKWWHDKKNGEVKGYAVVSGMETMAEWGMVSCNRLWDYREEVNDLPAKDINNIESWVVDNGESISPADEDTFISDQEQGRLDEEAIGQALEELFGIEEFNSLLTEM